MMSTVPLKSLNQVVLADNVRSYTELSKNITQLLRDADGGKYPQYPRKYDSNGMPENDYSQWNGTITGLVAYMAKYGKNMTYEDCLKLVDKGTWSAKEKTIKGLKNCKIYFDDPDIDEAIRRARDSDIVGIQDFVETGRTVKLNNPVRQALDTIKQTGIITPDIETQIGVWAGIIERGVKVYSEPALYKELQKQAGVASQDKNLIRLLRGYCEFTPVQDVYTPPPTQTKVVVNTKQNAPTVELF